MPQMIGIIEKYVLKDIFRGLEVFKKWGTFHIIAKLGVSSNTCVFLDNVLLRNRLIIIIIII